MSNDTIRINSASLADVQLLLKWASDEGWNPGIDDARLFHSADPGGFFMAFDGSIPAAGVSVIRQGADHGFLGLYLCHPDYRGQGYGWAVWQAGMHYLEGRVVGLDGVVEQQANYRKSGYELAYRNIRYQGSPSDKLAALSGNANTSDSALKCTPICQDDWPEALALDKHVHGYDRTQLLRSWLTEETSRHSWICRLDGNLQGFSTIRQCQNGYKVGPLIARNPAIANTLLATMVSQTSAEMIILDIPEPNEGAIKLAEQLALEPVFETARMYRGKRPSSNLNLLFGVTSFELG